MRLYIALALIAVAAAAPESVTLPKAALPVVDDALPDVEPIDLPVPETPAGEAVLIEMIDISPMFVPEEVMEEVRAAQLAEDLGTAVHFIDNAEDVLADEWAAPADYPVFDGTVPREYLRSAKSPEQFPVNPDVVRIVDFAQDDAEQPVDAIPIVENFDDIRNAIREEIAAGELETIRIAFPIPVPDVEDAPDAVRVVDEPFRGPGKIFNNPILR